MNNAYIKVYPVLNGACTLVHTEDNQFILIDCKISRDSDDPENEEFFGVKDDLVDVLPTNEYGAPYIHLFVLSHPDQDHCKGFETHFYTGLPGSYSKSDKEDKKIMIDEMWSSKLIYGEVCDDAKCIRKEIVRRRQLYTSASRDNETAYNRLSMIGHDDDSLFTDVAYYRAGDETSRIAGAEAKYLSIFIHGPLKKSLVTAEATEDRNVASVIAQYKLTSPDHDQELLFLEGGDADHYCWAEVKRITEREENNDFLRFDVFLAPHHCSWSFYNDRPYAENKDAQQASKDLLSTYAQENGFLISSSKEIVDDDKNPPHYPAKKEYEKKYTQ
jgi:hypothetical protein